MSGAARRAWPGLAAALAVSSIAALAAWPVLRAGYPSIGDGLIHFYRLVEFEHLLRQGVWFPRWAPDFGYGFGYPLFNYTPPLPYYLGALLSGLGLSHASSLLGVYALAFLLAAAGAYGLARERWGTAAGLAAAAAYCLAPYQYFNALARGALPETLGLGLLPWVLWAFMRLARQPGPGALAAAAAAYAALVLTHLIGAALAAPLIALISMAALSRANRASSDSQGWRGPERRRQRPGSAADRGRGSGTRTDRSDRRSGGRARADGFAPVLAAALLALGLAAYFVLPAVLETGYVQIEQLTRPADLDYRNNFLALSELWAWPQPFDARLVFQAVPPSLSLALLPAAAFGLLLRRRGDLWPAGLALAAAVAALFTLPVTAALWALLPLAETVQFPWRLVGPASLMLALLAGAGVGGLRRLEGPGLAGLAAATMLAVCWLFSLTWSFGPAYNAPQNAAVQDLPVYEAASGQLGSTSTGEFLPVGVESLPDPAALLEAYASADVIMRLAAQRQDVTVHDQRATATSAAADVTADANTGLVFNIFYFPGWRATVDGQPAPIAASGPHGLIRVPLAAGRQQVEVRFGPTPLRAGASALSAAAASSALALAVVPAIRRRREAAPRQQAGTPPAAPARWQSAALPVVLAALALLAARALLIDGRESLFSQTRFDGARVAGVGQPLDVNFDDQLVLMGYDLARGGQTVDDSATVTLYWRAQTALLADYSITLQAVDQDGHVFGQSDSQHPGRTPTTRWQPGQYARDVHQLTLLPGAPPGEYRLMAGVYVVNGRALAVLDEARQPQGSLVEVGTLTATRAQRTPDDLGIGQRLDAALGPLTLLGVTVHTPSPQAGDEALVTLYWQAQGASRPDVGLRLELLADDGSVIQVLERAAARDGYPASAWAGGEAVRAPLRLSLPANAPAGSARLMVSLVSANGALVGGPTEAARLDVDAPERSYDLPTPEHALEADFSGQARLLGYDLTADGVRVYWQALSLMDTSYKVFVHALDVNGDIVAQADGFPAGGARPTTGWLPGEVITDAHGLAWEGAAALALGLYDPATGARLGLARAALP